jgi:hypothetical protein
MSDAPEVNPIRCSNCGHKEVCMETGMQVASCGRWRPLSESQKAIVSIAYDLHRLIVAALQEVESYLLSADVLYIAFSIRRLQVSALKRQGELAKLLKARL